MERLTERYRDYIRIKGCSTLYSREERKGACLNNAVVRLAAYEDTWMEPDDIESLKIIPATNELLAYRALGTVEELSELVKARDEGRLVELPCKRGDKVWRICGPKGRKFVAERTVLSVTIYEPGQFEIFTNCSDWLGRTVFLTRQEAEAALGGSGDV